MNKTICALLTGLALGGCATVQKDRVIETLDAKSYFDISEPIPGYHIHDRDVPTLLTLAMIFAGETQERQVSSYREGIYQINRCTVKGTYGWSWNPQANLDAARAADADNDRLITHQEAVQALEKYCPTASTTRRI